jgi:beta-lactamase class A
MDRRRTRRQLATGAGALVLAGALRPVMAEERLDADRAAQRLQALERESGGRLGVAVLDVVSGLRLQHRADERFPLCSTFKALLAGAVLARVDGGRERLDRRLRFEASDLVPYSPVTGPRAGRDGFTVSELCDAAVTLSDNTAANLLLPLVGGPDGLTAYLRTLGDAVTRLDRTEPDLNEARPGDERDTTSPAAMTRTLAALALGDALSPGSREILTGWLLGCRTGDKRLRAGLPSSWRVGDKTGSGERGTANDVAIAWPPGRPPLVVAAYLTGSTLDASGRDAVLANVARVAASVAN